MQTRRWTHRPRHRFRTVALPYLSAFVGFFGVLVIRDHTWLGVACMVACCVGLAGSR